MIPMEHMNENTDQIKQTAWSYHADKRNSIHDKKEEARTTIIGTMIAIITV